ncbi:hypothetical protein CEW92_11705 [Bacillaceae bacterium SAS-127]|nr:hypothetical protein CEW92_11705 [Bacillaceae bacterium SAS-127]
MIRSYAELSVSALMSLVHIPFVGIDDFAFKKRFRYGTIFVDLITHQPIDILPTRDRIKVTEWLHSHPEIQIISRDGSPSYARAASDAIPKAIQVGDRWHILHQLFETIKKQLSLLLPAKWKTSPVGPRKNNTVTRPLSKKDRYRKANEEKRWKRIQIVQRMRAEGVSIQSIANELQIDRKTVYADLNTTSKPSHRRHSKYDKWRPRIRNLLTKRLPGRKITEICQSEGFTGSHSTLSHLISDEKRNMEKSETIVLSLRQKALLAIWEESDEKFEAALITLHPKLPQMFPELLELRAFVSGFRQLFVLKERSGLRKWLIKHRNTGFVHLQSFIRGIKSDLKATWYATILPWSNGPVEGQVNRLKMIKRMMYGRGSFEVIRNRLLFRW